MIHYLTADEAAEKIANKISPQIDNKLLFDSWAKIIACISDSAAAQHIGTRNEQDQLGFNYQNEIW